MKVLFFQGQGAQFKGMGKDLWSVYPRTVDAASEILGYSIAELCLRDPYNQLGLTAYTQPALYVVNALAYYRWRESGAIADALAGHSLGEYSALLAAECFDFETGLRLVQKRGELMGKADGGTMAAVLGMRAEVLQAWLRENAFDNVDLANFNSPTQSVIAGEVAAIQSAVARLSARGVRCVPLNVSAPFHSRFMRSAQETFAVFLQDFSLADPKIPVVANTTARPYEPGQVSTLLAKQIASPVLWTESIRYLMGVGEFTYHEIGSDPTRMGGTVLGKLVDEIRLTETPLFDAKISPPPVIRAATLEVEDAAPPPLDPTQSENLAHTEDLAVDLAKSLGSAAFRQRHGLKYAYVAGAMYRGTASVALVVRMGQAGMIGYLGSGGLSLPEIEAAIRSIQAQLSPHEAYGLNLLADHDDPVAERATVELYLRYGVTRIEAAAFIQMTPALVLFRLRGLHRDAAGKVRSRHHVLAKVSRLEVAEAFMSPAPPHLVEVLLKERAITPEQAEMAAEIPMSHDICAEADSGGHTDGNIPTILLPAMRHLGQSLSERYAYQEPLCVGLGGGIGTPASAAAAFAMAADFILTGSINQCTVESGATETVKGLLQQACIHDMAHAPAGDMFEIGGRVQVLKKGLLFPMRANKLHALYTHHESLEDIPASVRTQLERRYFKRSLSEVWNEVVQHLQAGGRLNEIAQAQANPKLRMARVFRWYFAYATRLAFSGSSEDLVNYQVQCGPALGAFNQWVKGTVFEAWPQRHVDRIGIALMDATAEYLRDGIFKIRR